MLLRKCSWISMYNMLKSSVLKFKLMLPILVVNLSLSNFIKLAIICLRSQIWRHLFLFSMYEYEINLLLLVHLYSGFIKDRALLPYIYFCSSLIWRAGLVKPFANKGIKFICANHNYWFIIDESVLVAAADVFLWKDKKVTGGVLGLATAIWVLFELLEYHLLTLVCHILILGLAIIFLWSNASTFINKYGSLLLIIPD